MSTLLKCWAKRLVLLGLAVMGSTAMLHSDEGMWLYNNPPLKVLKERYNFEPTQEWLDHLRMSSVRFNSGGSGSFVSSNGLVLTNHHVGADTLQKISTKEKDYIKTGFLAKTQADEVPAKDLELNVLLSITDVTDKVNGAVKADMSPADQGLARRKVINELQAAALEGKDKNKSRADVVTLYNGGAYHLYQFKRYTDVRLVFAPEKDIAFFGGDPDNFEYPRYDLDVCFFRAYEDGKPAKPDHFLTWSQAGTKEGDLTFVSGHPGRTSRGFTMSHLEYIRDKLAPYQLNYLRRIEIMLKNYSDRSMSNAQEAQEDLFSIQNSRKARLGGLGGLQDPVLMAQKAKEEAALREAIAKDPKLKDSETAWAEVESTLKYAREYFTDYNLFERGQAFHSDLFGKARTLVRAADEQAKPDGERLREYSSSGIKSLELALFSEAPIHENLEVVQLADSLGMMIELAGVDHPLVKKILAGKSPQARASELVRGSKLSQVSERKKLFEGGKDAVAASSDPMIALAKLVDEEARKVRKSYEEKVEEPQRQAYGKMAKARFAVQGTGVYPDATFTLRLAFGQIKGFEENGVQVPAFTTLGGAFERSKAQGGQDPFRLPESWIKAKDRMKLDTPFNFVSTADIIGGNSGSPVVDRKGEFVGIIFDGNIQSLVLDYAYSDVIARAVSVDCRGIMEALRSVYNAEALIGEILAK